MNEKQAKDESQDKKKRKLFIGGLDKRVDEKMLKEYFEKYGEVERTIINREHYTDRSRGSGFVLFVTVESAKKVLDETSPHVLKGKIFDCQPCLLRSEVKEKKNRSLNKFIYSTDNSKKSSINDLKNVQQISNRRKKSYQYPMSANSLERNSNYSGSIMSPSIGSSNNLDESMFIEERRFEIVQEQRRRYSNFTEHHVYQNLYTPHVYNNKVYSNLNPNNLSQDDRLCYNPPTYQPREFSYDNKPENKKSLDVIKQMKESASKN